MTDVEQALHALSQLPLSDERKAALIDRSDEFVGRIMLAGINAGIRPAPKGYRGSPTEIAAAANDIARGLDMIERGLASIDGARRSTAIAATARQDALRDLHEDILRSIAAAVAGALPTAIIRDVDIDASRPTYTPSGFSNPWRGAFSRAAGQVDSIAANASANDLRAPKLRDEWFERLIGIMAEIYEDATGEIPRAYAPSQAASPDTHPPFCQFVRDIWPIFAMAGEVAPSDSRIRDAVNSASKLPPDIVR